MIKYKLKNYHLSNESNSYIKDYLNLIGIEKVESFINEPNEEDEIKPFRLKNMYKAIKMLKKHLDKNNEIFIQFDSDPDGYTSGTIIYNFIKKIKPESKIQYCLHKEKEHGVIINDVPFETDLIIIPDAGSNQWDDIEELISRGKEIIILDHHIVDGQPLESENYVLVNSTEDNFENSSLSGAGVAFKFIQAYDRYYDCGDIYKNYYDLAALGIISDMMYTGNLDNNYIIYQGLHNINNKFFKALLEKQAFSVSNIYIPTKIDVAFYITPIINGVIRVGTMEDKELMIHAFTEENCLEIFNHSFRGVTKEETLYERAARIAYNLKSKQDSIVDKSVEKIFVNIEKNKLNEDSIIIYKTSLKDQNEIPKTLTGLIAMKIVAKYNKPALVLRPKLVNNIQYYFGSGRGKNAEGFTSFKQLLNDSNLVEYASGHDNAFGTSIKETDIPNLISYANQTLSNIDFNSGEIIEVDQIFKNNYINLQMLKDFAEYEHIYGNGIPQPCYAFELIIPKNDIKIMGSKNNTLKFNCNGIDFIKFKASKEIEELEKINTNYIKVIAIGNSTINEFMGNRKVQVRINNLEWEEFKIQELF